MKIIIPKTVHMMPENISLTKIALYMPKITSTAPHKNTINCAVFILFNSFNGYLIFFKLFYTKRLKNKNIKNFSYLYVLMTIQQVQGIKQRK